jgi:tetratricopeptide (TPR) repeat protein
MRSPRSPFRRCTLVALLLLAEMTVASAEISSRAPPQSTEAVERIVEEANVAEARFDTKKALELFLRANDARPDDATILQKISRQYSDLSIEAPDLPEKKKLCAQALDYAQRAYALDRHNAVNVLSVAISYGKLGLCSDTRTKIEYSRFVKQYAEEALALDPNYAYAHHVLGRWHYEVASIGTATRLLVKLVYGRLPPASLTEAVHQLRRAVELEPSLPAHRVELGFALLADGQRAAAHAAFREALALPRKEKYDDEAWKRARAALAD